MKQPIRFAGVALLAAATLSLPSASDACAPAPMRGVVVEVASESAIIIWDAKTKTQHFIRRATFTATGKDSTPVNDFGFLVPTPSQPVLEEADDKAFDELAKITAPKTVTEKRPSGGGCFIGCGMMSAPPGAAAPIVEVLAEKRVAGYDAKVLKANDANALTMWLNERGYEVRPALTRWLKPYIDKGWVVTAFKIAREPSAPAETAVGATAVRMSFTTDTPFFPYSEPDDMREAKGNRLLRVYFIGDQKMTGKTGANAVWPGKTAWAGKPTAESWKATLPHLKLPGFRPMKDAWLTEFEDSSSPRVGESDLTFSPADDQTPVHRPDHISFVARTDTGAGPTFAALGVVVACLYLCRFFSVRANRRT